MARVTVEDCVDKVSNRFDLVLFAAQRARQVSGGADLTIDRDRDKNPVVALREIAEETVKPKDLEEAIVTNLQKVRVDEEDETEEMSSLSEAAEALRLTAAAPPRPAPSGGGEELVGGRGAQAGVTTASWFPVSSQAKHSSRRQTARCSGPPSTRCWSPICTSKRRAGSRGSASSSRPMIRTQR